MRTRRSQTAFKQLQTYKQEIPSLFAYNAALIISDGVEARMGTLTAEYQWFMPWRTIAGEELASESMPQLQVVIEGGFGPASPPRPYSILHRL